MEISETLQTERLLLEKPTMNDAEEMFSSYTSDPEVTKFVTWKPHTTVDETRKFITYCLDAWQRHEHNYVVRQKETKEIIGMAKLQIKDGVAHIGYVLAKRAWGNGYATETLKQLMSYSLTLPEVARVEVFCDVENKASSRVMEKAGMRFKETRKHAIVHPNISPDPRDILVYVKEK